MRITCPQCHTPCRLKNDTAINDASQGKCPECGHIFPIPPGVIREEPTTGKRSGKQKKAGFDPDFKIAAIKSFLGRIPPTGKTSLFWIFSGLSLAMLLAALFFGPEKTLRPQPDLAAKQPTELNLTPQAKAKALAQIKHHTLVGDADISITDNYLQLALLVAGNTPTTYAERLGRQFAHYLKEQLTATDQPERKLIIKVSVYYPSGTRIEVATNDYRGEEEILPQMNYKLMDTVR